MSPSWNAVWIAATLLACSGAPSTDSPAAGGTSSGTGPELGTGVPRAGELTASSFRYGMNAGYPNPAFNDRDLSSLGMRAGVTSTRVSLPESHLERWGYDIEVSDVQNYLAMGMGSLVGFLTSPIRAHSTAPASAADWELLYYLPANLREPILGADGLVNPQNYWANYVYKTVQTYGNWIKVWEIWNEPDWVSDYRITEQWPTRAPTKADLPRFNGTIFDYVRLLRVSAVAAKLADPEARIATGGIGYASFLDAAFRYSDEPTSGSIDAEHPKAGRDYVDVVSFHHYPIYTPGNSDAAVAGFIAQKAALGAVVATHGKSLAWECTETGAPHLAMGTFPGGVDYAKNYLLKVMALAPEAGLSGLHWFALSDAADAATSGDPYDAMGLYSSVAALSSVAQATLTETGVAYRTLTDVLAGSSYDPTTSTAWRAALSNQVKVVAYRAADTRTRAVIWSIAEAGTESSTQTVKLASDRNWLLFQYDASRTGLRTLLSPQGGTVSLAVTATPSFLIEQ